MFTVLVDPCRLAGVDWLRREIDGFIDYVKASPPADPKLPVLVPGEPERIAHNERARTGIEVDAHDLGRDPRRRGGGRGGARRGRGNGRLMGPRRPRPL